MERVCQGMVLKAGCLQSTTGAGQKKGGKSGEEKGRQPIGKLTCRGTCILEMSGER